MHYSKNRRTVKAAALAAQGPTTGRVSSALAPMTDAAKITAMKTHILNLVDELATSRRGEHNARRHNEDLMEANDGLVVQRDAKSTARCNAEYQKGKAVGVIFAAGVVLLGYTLTHLSW